MNPYPLSIVSSGMVTCVGMDAPSSCAAIRAAIANFTETRFMGDGGEWLIGAQVELEQPWRGRTKLVKMLASSITECLQGIAKEDWRHIALMLCVAEPERPGRTEGLDDVLFLELCKELDAEFHPRSAIVAHGRVAAAVALKNARHLIYKEGISHVLITGADSYLSWPTLRYYQNKQRLLTAENSNGFIPGEAGAAVLVSKPHTQGKQLRCWGLGFGVEKATVESEEPLRADGLAAAMKDALQDAGVQMQDLDFRIADISGEQYMFKEAALALARNLKIRKENYDLWCPASQVGETGAASMLIGLSVALAASQKGYLIGPGVMLHAGLDNGRRSTLVAVMH
jgi:3-oxoacyl-[acyl-carrier-protein] synthase I